MTKKLGPQLEQYCVNLGFNGNFLCPVNLPDSWVSEGKSKVKALLRMPHFYLLHRNSVDLLSKHTSIFLFIINFTIGV